MEKERRKEQRKKKKKGKRKNRRYKWTKNVFVITVSEVVGLGPRAAVLAAAAAGRRYPAARCAQVMREWKKWKSHNGCMLGCVCLRPTSPTRQTKNEALEFHLNLLMAIPGATTPALGDRLVKLCGSVLAG